ncbi:MAG: hypothetical protein [Bacteriophage sp.]|nr:MAG: hypothetical protein [Bacteriophage sp.]
MNKIVWSLFDGSGYAVIDWAERGYTCFCINADDADHGDYQSRGARIEHPKIHYVNKWIDKDFFDDAVAGLLPELGKPSLILAFPPCTDLANSGSRHWANKREANPDFQIDAMITARIASNLANYWGVPYMIENPVGMLSTLWRKPDVYVDPWEFGGHLERSEWNHPAFPDYIMPRDAYPKKTGLWVGNGFKMPERKPVFVPGGYSRQYAKLGGKSTKAKIIRSLTPRGLARAIFKANR